MNDVGVSEADFAEMLENVREKKAENTRILLRANLQIALQLQQDSSGGGFGKMLLLLPRFAGSGRSGKCRITRVHHR